MINDMALVPLFAFTLRLPLVLPCNFFCPTVDFFPSEIQHFVRTFHFTASSLHQYIHISVNTRVGK